MKVVLNTCWSSAPPHGETTGKSFRPGEVADVPSDVGKQLIEGRYATLEKHVAKKRETVAEAEQADDTLQPKKVRGGRTRRNDTAGD